MAEQTRVQEILEDLQSADPMFEADILLLQEVLHAGHQTSLPGQLASRLRLHTVFAAGDELEDGALRGLAILSRFKLSNPHVERLKRFDLRFKSRCRVALGVTVDSPWGPIRVVNVHLDSRINANERLEQLAPVVSRLSSFPGPQLIAGDFNTANVMWWRRWLPLPFFSLQSQAVRRLVDSHGFTTPFTSTGRTFSYLPLKLDWIFVKGLRWLEAGIEPVGFSDHRGLWVKLAGEGLGLPAARVSSQTRSAAYVTTRLPFVRMAS
jgi:endonuclease/exonuclease/phosphatase family metal-dependent hydrolase